MKIGVTSNGVKYRIRHGARKGYETDLKVLEYFDNPAVIAALGDPEAKLIEYVALSTKDGGTQSQGGRLILSNGKEYFVKQAGQISHVSKQRLADQKIRLAMGTYIADAPFPFMEYGNDDFNKKNGLIVLKNISGKTLISHATSSDEQLAKIYTNIGAALGRVHVACLLNKGNMEEFYEKGCSLNRYEVLVHEDFQSSNIMIANDGNVFFVDTDGIEVSKNAYKNIQELWGMCDNAEQMKVALEGYLTNYEPSKQQQVLDNIRSKLEEVPDAAYPSKLPVAAAPAIQQPPKSTTQLKEPRKELEKSIKVSKKEGADEEVKRQKIELERIKVEEENAKAAAAFAHKQEHERKILAASVKKDAHEIKGNIKSALKELHELVLSYKQSPNSVIEANCKNVIKSIERLKSQLDQKFLVLTSAGSNDNTYDSKVAGNILAASGIKEDLHIPKLELNILTSMSTAKKEMDEAKENQRLQMVAEQERKQQAALARQQEEEQRLQAEQERLDQERVRIEQERAKAQKEHEEAARQEQLRVAKEQEEKRVAQENERLAQEKAREEAILKERGEKQAAERLAKETAAAEKLAAEKALDAQKAAEQEPLIAKGAEAQKEVKEKGAEARKAAEAALKAAELENDAAEQARIAQDQAELQRLREEQLRLEQERERLKAEQAALAVQKASEERGRLEKERQAQAELAKEQERARVAQQRALEVERLKHEQEAEKAAHPVIKVKEDKPTEPKWLRAEHKQALPDPTAFAELDPSSKRSVDALLASYGNEKSAIERMLKNQYQGKRTEKKLKGLMQNFAISRGYVFSNKRDKQISDLATVMAKLQAELNLNSHEKAIILLGALQSVIDTIQRTEKNNAFQSRLLTICQNMQEGIKARNVDVVDPDVTKILCHTYNSEGGVTAFRKTAMDLHSPDTPQVEAHKGM